MRDVSTENYNALKARRLIARDFSWFIVRDRETGLPVTDGYWSDVGTITAAVVDPNTGGSQSRQWAGAGELIQISDISLVSDLTVRNVSVTLSQVVDRVNTLVREYDCKQGQVQIFRGMFDEVSRVIVGPAFPRFVGFIDDIQIKTPKENEQGSVVLTCVSHTQEMTRSNSDTRSHESQILRLSTDTFYHDTAVVSEWVLFWGRSSGSVPTAGSTGGFFGRIAQFALGSGLLNR